MIINVYTYNGHAINDTTNYTAYLTNFYEQGESNVNEGRRTSRPPVMLGKEPLSKTFYLVITPKGTTHSQWAELNKWFDTNDATEYALIIKDTADSSKQWYVKCTPKRGRKDRNGFSIIYEMHCTDPIWRTVTEHSDTWTITASGQTRDLTMYGNRWARPKFRIKPTALKLNGHKYRMFRVWRNPNDEGQNRRLQDVVGAHTTSISNQINNGAGYSSSATSLALDTSVGGGLPTGAGVAYVSRTGELIKYSGISAGTMTVTTRGYGGTTAAALNDNDVLCAYGWNTNALVKDTSNSCQVNNGAGITAADTTIPYDTVTGTLPDKGMGYLDTEQISWTGKTGTTSGNLTGVTRGIGGTTAATHADNTVIYLSHIQADGRDVRVYVNGVSIPRWLRNMNTHYTSVFVNLDWDSKISLTLGANIASSGSISAIQFDVSNVAELRKILEKNNLAVGIGTEVFTFTHTDVDLVERKINNPVRASYSTSEAAHTSGDTAYWIQHRIEIAYGNYSASAPTQDETSAPLQDLDNSVNTGWKFLLFGDSSGLRGGQWLMEALKGYQSYVYYGSHKANTSPYTEIGLVGGANESGGGVKADSYELAATLYDMAGFTSLTPNGYKHRTSTDWATVSGMRKSENGSTGWTNIFTEATPASASTWTALTADGVAQSLSGTYKGIQLYHKGSCKAVTDNEHTIELTTLQVSLQANNLPQLVFAGAELSDTYDLDCTITNNDTGLYIQIAGPMDYNQTIEVDTFTKTVTYLKDNSNAFPFLKVAVRGEWLPIDPAVVTDNINTLTYTETACAGVEITTYWYDRYA